MTFLPIVSRELRVMARRRAAHGVRVLSVLGSLLVAGWIMLIPYYRAPQRLGITMFVWLAGLAFVYCLFAGLFTTSDCLSREKREGTFGLLFLTDLKGFDIVFGKLAATSMNALYGLVAIFPVMAIPFLSGGVTPGELLRVVLALLNAMFFSLSAGMLASSISRNDRRAGSLTVLFIIGIAGGLPLLGVLLDEWLKVVSQPSPYLLVWSPGCGFAMAFEETHSRMRTFDYFKVSLALVHVLSWGFLLLACIIVPRVWQDRANSARKQDLRLKWRNWAQGTGARRQEFRRRLLNINPILWLTARDRLQPVFVWVVLALAGLAWVWGWAENGRDWFDEAIWLLTALSLNSILKIWVASAACQRFNEDHQSGALELMLATPLTVREMVRGQLMALRRQFLKPALVVLGVDLACLLSNTDQDEWVLMCLLGIGMFILDLFTLAWVSMWMGLKIKASSRAAAAAMVRVLVLPWLLFFVVSTLVALRWIRVPGRYEEEMFLVGWFVIGALTDVVFYFSARQGLFFRFRELAAQRFAPKSRSWWPFGNKGTQNAGVR